MFATEVPREPDRLVWKTRNSLHISVAFIRVDGEIQMLTFCHIFKACSQDSNAVLAVMADLIQQLKSIMPSLTTVYYRQDNAGCYHCGHVIISSSKLGQKEGIVLKRLDFSDPQGGKVRVTARQRPSSLT